MITIYHVVDPTFRASQDPSKTFIKDSEPVALVNTNDLDIAYEKTNHIDCSWWENKEIKLCKKNKSRLRSTSVGDFMILENVLYEVSSVGFKKIKTLIDY